MTSRRARGAIAVALHDVEPATFERCALIRDWLDDHGIERVTLLVIPAAGMSQAVARDGLREYYDRRTGAGLAARGFSSSALVADLASA